MRAHSAAGTMEVKLSTEITAHLQSRASAVRVKTWRPTKARIPYMHEVRAIAYVDPGVTHVFPRAPKQALL